MTVEIDYLKFHRVILISVTYMDWETATDWDWRDWIIDTIGL